TLYIPTAADGRVISGHISTANDKRGGAGLKTETVPAHTLETALAHFGGADCDFLKVDCEGAEYDIFLGASPDLLRRFKRVAIETHLGRGEELRDLFKDAGFTITEFRGGRVGLVKAVN
ncbi:MAG: FkbM family methyltransferase, partial [Phenylobacterium sp.]